MRWTQIRDWGHRCHILMGIAASEVQFGEKNGCFCKGSTTGTGTRGPGGSPPGGTPCDKGHLQKAAEGWISPFL